MMTNKIKIALFILFVSIISSNDDTQKRSLQSQEKKDKQMTFQDYCIKFKKFYKDIQEKQKRYEIFQQNMFKIRKSGCKPCGPTKFTDQSEEQVARRKGFRVVNEMRKIKAQKEPQIQPQIETEQVLFASSVPFNDNTPKITNNNSGVPKTFDWRDYDVITSIKDQFDCGNCWAFSTVSFFQSQLIRRDQADTKIDLSQQFLLQCDSKSFGCNGGNLYSAMDLVLARGLPLEKDYPFSPKFWYPGICTIGRGPTYPYSRRVTVTDLSDSQLISYLLQRPLNIGIKAANWQNYAPNGTQRTFKCPQLKNGIKQFNHAVALIGFTQTEWIIKNSWGTDWGVDGYMYITRQNKYNCGIGLEINTLNYKLEAVKEKKNISQTSNNNTQDTTNTDNTTSNVTLKNTSTTNQANESQSVTSENDTLRPNTIVSEQTNQNGLNMSQQSDQNILTNNQGTQITQSLDDQPQKV